MAYNTISHGTHASSLVSTRDSAPPCVSIVLEREPTVSESDSGAARAQMSQIRGGLDRAP